jgi:hypothetical protein
MYCQWFQPMKWIRWSVKQVFRNQLELEDKLIRKQKSSTNHKTPQDLELHVLLGGNGQSNSEDGPKTEHVPGGNGQSNSEVRPEIEHVPGGNGQSNSEDRPEIEHVPGGNGQSNSEDRPEIEHVSGGNGQSNGKDRPEHVPGGNGQSNGEDGPKILLNHRSTVILFTLIATFGLLAIGSALNVTLLSVTHACTEAPDINCYPQPIDAVKVENAGLNISTDKPIEDCSFWNSEGVSDKVSIICYQFVLNVEIFLAVIGGLLTVFVVTMRAVIGVLLWCIRKCGNRYRMCLQGKCGKCIPVARYVFVVILSGIEVLMVIVGMVLQGSGTSVNNTNDTQGVTFLATHAAEILLVIGIVPTLLLLPWEDYATKNNNQSADIKKRSIESDQNTLPPLL